MDGPALWLMIAFVYKRMPFSGYKRFTGFILSMAYLLFLFAIVNISMRLFHSWQ